MATDHSAGRSEVFSDFWPINDQYESSGIVSHCMTRNTVVPIKVGLGVSKLRYEPDGRWIARRSPWWPFPFPTKHMRMELNVASPLAVFIVVPSLRFPCRDIWRNLWTWNGCTNDGRSIVRYPMRKHWLFLPLNGAKEGVPRCVWIRFVRFQECEPPTIMGHLGHELISESQSYNQMPQQ